jgi:two-component system response regulator QseB
LILCVDDTDTNRAIIKSMLRAAGVEMAEADNAEAGLSMIDTGDYDVILMDLRMPGTDGLAAIRRIRARADAKAQLPVIVITADDTADIRQQATAAGADELLHKPVEMAGLFDAIGRVMTKRDGGAMLA